MKRSAFTLVEMMVSIAILSLMMLFLYKSYAQINQDNEIFKTKSLQTQEEFLRNKTLFLDLTLATAKSITILNQDKQSDIVFMQTSNSLYGRINPFVAYIKKDKKLFRLESLKPFKEYPLNSENDFIGEMFATVESFRLYSEDRDANTTNASSYLLHVTFEKDDTLLYKIQLLNEE